MSQGDLPVRRCLRPAIALALLVALTCRLPAQDAAPRVTEVPAELRAALKLDPFYQKYTDYHGYPILSSAQVSDAGLLEARYLISRMLAGRDDLVQALRER